MNFLENIDFIFLAASLIKIIVFTFLIILPFVAYSVYAERKVAAIIQDRVGPNRVGLPLTLLGFKSDIKLFGLFQPMADGVKSFLKEDYTPAHVKKFFFWLAPLLVLVPALLTCAVIPFGSSLFGHRMVIADIDLGPIFIFSIASLSVYGIVLAGWSSNSKYPFLGSIRSMAQMISYEISMGLSIVPILMIFGNLNLSEIVLHQQEEGWLVLPFTGKELVNKEQLFLLIPIIISFVIFVTSLFAETNRMPFDLPECETELVGGYNTEYSSMKFALFFMGEYAAMIVGSALLVTLFFGGWSLPFGLLSEVDRTIWWKDFLVGFVHINVFLFKVVLFIIFFIWVRWSTPRFRYDQLMRLGWVFFFEIALANILLTALILTFIN